MLRIYRLISVLDEDLTIEQLATLAPGVSVGFLRGITEQHWDSDDPVLKDLSSEGLSRRVLESYKQELRTALEKHMIRQPDALDTRAQIIGFCSTLEARLARAIRHEIQDLALKILKVILDLSLHHELVERADSVLPLCDKVHEHWPKRTEHDARVKSLAALCDANARLARVLWSSDHQRRRTRTIIGGAFHNVPTPPEEFVHVGARLSLIACLSMLEAGHYDRAKDAWADAASLLMVNRLRVSTDLAVDTVEIAASLFQVRPPSRKRWDYCHTIVKTLANDGKVPMFTRYQIHTSLANHVPDLADGTTAATIDVTSLSSLPAEERFWLLGFLRTYERILALEPLAQGLKTLLEADSTLGSFVGRLRAHSDEAKVLDIHISILERLRSGEDPLAVARLIRSKVKALGNNLPRSHTEFYLSLASALLDIESKKETLVVIPSDTYEQGSFGHPVPLEMVAEATRVLLERYL